MGLRRATALIGLAAVLVAPATVRADGDPASDVLIFQDAYLPYFPAPSDAEAETLTRLLADLRERGFPVKVALIHNRGDLGANPDMFNRPDDYVRLLDRHIRFHARQARLLVVMPAGMAGFGLGPEAQEIIDSIEIDAAAESDGLARAAIEAVARIASASGHDTPVPEIATDPESGDGPPVALLVVAGLLVALGVGFVAIALRVRARRSPA